MGSREARETLAYRRLLGYPRKRSDCLGSYYENVPRRSHFSNIIFHLCIPLCPWDLGLSLMEAGMAMISGRGGPRTFYAPRSICILSLTMILDKEMNAERFHAWTKAIQLSSVLSCSWDMSKKILALCTAPGCLMGKSPWGKIHVYR